ncbi:MAG TPA: CPBP family intramembrane glutamic endopeptidase [Terriglobales bacterium]|nr:CPBP family intramembrane glutamic endopeptidase [Terriglobales bacterium]
MINESPHQSSKRLPLSGWIGLFLALFGMLIIRSLYDRLAPDPVAPHSVFVREIVFYLFAAAILLFVRFVEGRPLTSIGIGTSTVAKTLLRGLLLGLLCLLAGGMAGFLTHFNGGQTGKVLSKLPLWLVVMIVVRAGIVEELCYRGYSIERLQQAGLPKFWAAFVPLMIFATAHWTNGWANVVIAFVIGAVLAAFYLWRRDLLGNMFAHFFVDFISVILPRLLH